MLELELINGVYYVDCCVIEEVESVKNMEDVKKFYDYCNEVILVY